MVLLASDGMQEPLQVIGPGRDRERRADPAIVARRVAMAATGPQLRWATALAALALAGCGGDEEYTNEPRSPAPINVTAAITEKKLAVSPRRFGAGPINLIVSNQTEDARSVTFETD